MAVKAEDAGVKVCTGLISYSTRVHVEVDPCCDNSFCRVVDRFKERRLQYRPGSTNTNGALKVLFRLRVLALPVFGFFCHFGDLMLSVKQAQANGLFVSVCWLPSWPVTIFIISR